MASPAPVQNAAADYMPAQVANTARENAALGRAAASPPQTYQYDVNKANTMAGLLGRYAATQKLNNLKAVSPAAYQGTQRAIAEISGGQPGDDQMLRNNALKSGLETNAGSGAMVNGAGSVGGVNTANIYGRDLLGYQQQRAQEQLGLASALAPDTTIDPGQGVSAYMGNDARAVDNANQYKNFLSGLSFTGINNANNQLQQNESTQQSVNNARAQNEAAASGENIGLIGSGIQAVGSLAGGLMSS